MLKTYKYRLYPDGSQREKIKKTADACRFIYNWALETGSTAYKRDKTSLSAYDLHALLPELKKEHPWLATPYSQSLQQSVRRQYKALQNFFRRVKRGEERPGYPKFRSKRHHRQSFDIPQGIKIEFEKRNVYLPKIGLVRTVFHRRFEGAIKNCTVIVTNTGKHFICIVVEDGRVPPKKKRVNQKKSIGIDVGLKTYATISNGEKIENPRFLEISLKRVKCLHRRLSKKKRGSKNREKARIRYGKCREKISDQRRDFQQKLTTRLIRENQAIMVESLNVSGMVKNRRLSKAISDAAWSSFLNMLRYKSELYGVSLIEVGMFEPTSKLCHVCGFKNDGIKLKDREWPCPQCKTKHDRDTNAALNIKMIGFKTHHASREQRKGPVDQSTLVDGMKQEAHH
ncbi:MAG: transposase [Candidatus Thorarchaeota archaeon]|nr:transposase [Candidatus Thorarchaeota archaeon]